MDRSRFFIPLCTALGSNIIIIIKKFNSPERTEPN